MLNILLAEIMEPPILLGLFTFLLGVLVVFCGMLVLVLFVSAMGKAFTKKSKKEEEPKEDKVPEVVETAPVEIADSDEIPEHVRVAIIAAIACYYEGTQAKNEFTVKKIKKLRN